MNGMHNHSQLHNWLCVVASLPLTLTLLWTWKLDLHSGRLLKLCLVSRVLYCESIYWHQFATNDWEWWMLFSELVSLNVPKKNNQCLVCSSFPDRFWMCGRTVVSSRSPPRPGYTLKSSTLPVNGRQFGADYLVIDAIKLFIVAFFIFQRPYSTERQVRFSSASFSHVYRLPFSFSLFFASSVSCTVLLPMLHRATLYIDSKT